MGMVTDSANAVWVDGGADIELVRSGVLDGAYRLRSSKLIMAGLPVLETNAGEVITRPVSTRRQQAEERRLRGRVERTRPLEVTTGDAFCPEGVPQGRHPKLLTRSATRFGISSRGTRTVLSGPHSTIIGGESGSLVYPDRYPYTAVCKLYLSYQPKQGGAWVGAGEGDRLPHL